MKTIAVAKCKAQFLSLIKEVENKRAPVLVTRNGKPVAKLVPLEIEEDSLAIFRYSGLQKTVSDEELVKPLYSDKEYEDFFEIEAAKYK